MDEVQPDQVLTGEAVDDLVPASGGPSPSRGQLLKDISNAMVGLKKQYYGRGPTKAKTYINDNIVFCVLEGGLTRNEETLFAAGEEKLIRQYRLRFQEVVTQTAESAVEELTGRRVMTYHSQIVFNPHTVFEIFVLDREP
ncbi:MAG: hypothetical protein QOC95_1809 [Thermoleophilaceae bacterium]|jgi:uncharacterized protein YbcI|nr:hypothetical protein [Thermoleophilaceae bacterium]